MAREQASWAFEIGDRVRKVKGSAWRGRVVGRYSTALTQFGVVVESDYEPGSVHVYPEAALAAIDEPAGRSDHIRNLKRAEEEFERAGETPQPAR